MTRERREEVVFIALVASVAIHAALMLLARSQVMTRPLSPTARTVRREAMRVVKREPRPEPTAVESLRDLAAVRDAPAAVPAKTVPGLRAPSSEDFRGADVPTPELPAVAASPRVEAAVFDVRPAGRETGPAAVPILRIETPSAVPRAAAAPVSDASVSAVFRPPSVSVPSSAAAASAPRFPAARMAGPSAPPAAYVPPAEVSAKVDERLVADEKSAVRALVDAADAADMRKFVNVTMSSARADGWRYFRVMLSPRADLKVVPKDVVVLIDGSGSIGNDRLGSCRAAARRILRTAANTGDRFNLVVFRNDFSYAFRSWRPCDAASFAAGDRWLSNQTAHGRTDVFSTIRSVLTLPRDPKRPLIALVVTDGDANSGVSDTAEILSKFTALNDGLVSVYMYGVKSSANRELIDVLTHGNRGESFVFDGWRWNAGSGLEALSNRFRDPVLSDLRLVFSAGTRAEAYPRLLRNLYRGDTLTFVGRVPSGTEEVAFSLKGLGGDAAFEGYFKLPFATAPNDPTLVADWNGERVLADKLRN